MRGPGRALVLLLLAAPAVGAIAWVATRPVYGFRADRFSDDWAPPIVRTDGSRAAMVAYDAPRDASRAARVLVERVQTTSMAFDRGAYRYVRRDNGLLGVVLVVDRVLVHVEARTADDVERLIAEFPFIEPPGSGVVLSRIAPVVASMIAAYGVVAVIALRRIRRRHAHVDAPPH